MCFDCGCGQWDDCHGDIRHVATVNISGALDANDGNLTPAQMVANIKDGLDNWLSEQGDATKSVHMHGDGFRYRISIEEV